MLCKTTLKRTQKVRFYRAKKKNSIIKRLKHRKASFIEYFSSEFSRNCHEIYRKRLSKKPLSSQNKIDRFLLALQCCMKMIPPCRFSVLYSMLLSGFLLCKKHETLNAKSKTKLMFCPVQYFLHSHTFPVFSLCKKYETLHTESTIKA
jgi:hypothetical protein